MTKEPTKTDTPAENIEEAKESTLEINSKHDELHSSTDEEVSNIQETKANENPKLRWLVILLRFLAGAIFIFSGYVKAIDPYGSIYKFQEYFQVLGLESLVGTSTFAAFAIAIFELMLGTALFVGAYRRGDPIVALLMMFVMLPLTFYLAITDAVPDCGCFGDALPMSNWVTFLKNIVITAILILLLKYNKLVPCIFGPVVQWIVLFFTFLLGLAIALAGYFYQPLIDFRPFAVGTNLNVLPAMGANDDDYVFIYKKDGVEQEFTIDNTPDEEDGWEFVDRRQVKPDISPAQQAQKQSISIYDEGDDVTSEVLDKQHRQLLFLFPDIANVNISYTFLINELNEFARVQDVDVYGLTSGTRQQIDEWNDISLADYPVYMTDDSDLKMMARGNPAVVFVEHGTIKWKRTLSSINPRRLDNENTTINNLSDDFNPQSTLKTIITLYLIAMIALLLVNRGLPIIKFFTKRKPAVQEED